MIDPYTQAMIDYREHLRSGGKRVSFPTPQRTGSKGLLYMSGAGPGLCPRESTYWAEVTAGVRRPDFDQEPINELMHVSADLIADFLAEALAWKGHLIGGRQAEPVGYEVSLQWPHGHPVWTGRVDNLADADTMPELCEEWDLKPRTLLVGDCKTAMGMNLNKHPKRWYVGQVEMYITALVDAGLVEAWGFKHVQPVIYQTLRTNQAEGFLCTWKWTDSGDCDVIQYGYRVPRKTFKNLSDDLQREAGSATRWKNMVDQSGWEVAEQYRPNRVGDKPEGHKPDGAEGGYPFKCCGQLWENNRKVRDVMEVHCQFFHTCWQTGSDFMRFPVNSITNPDDRDDDLPF